MKYIFSILIVLAFVAGSPAMAQNTLNANSGSSANSSAGSSSQNNVALQKIWEDTSLTSDQHKHMLKRVKVLGVD